MKKLFLFPIAVFLCNVISAQVQPTITKPEVSGQPYIITPQSPPENLVATESIFLLEGVHIQQGADFSAKIVEANLVQAAYTNISLSNENYIFSRNYQKGMTSFNPDLEADVLEHVTYFDGLGRAKQRIFLKASNDIKDIVTHIEYDNIGRTNKEFLPYEELGGALGAFRSGAKNGTNDYYSTNYVSEMNSSYYNPFSEKEFEPSPLNRVTKQAAPGYDWRLGGGHEINIGYETNSTNEVRKFTVTFVGGNSQNPSLTGGGTNYYAPGQLRKMVTKDENWVSGTDHTTEEFTDKLGRMVLTRTYNGAAHNTFYVYDDFGNLTYVLSPKMNGNAANLDELGYQYKYDSRNRLIEKKTPGKDWEYIVYNKLDQPILNKDAENPWQFIKYDAFGRVAITGSANGGNRAAEQAAADAYSGSLWVEKGSTNPTGKAIGYSADAYPSSGNYQELYTISYYDDYNNAQGISVPSSSYGQPTLADPKGLPTVSLVRVLGQPDWINTLTAYDEKGRAIYTRSENPFLGTEDMFESELDFVGKTLKTKASHTKGSNAPIVTVDLLEYDHEGRLKRQRQELGGNTEFIALHDYDGIGQLVKKEVGNSTSNPLQEVNLAYNIRGWLLGINTPTSLNNATETDLFAMTLNYNTSSPGMSGAGAPLYNGNISKVVWKTKNDVEAGVTGLRQYEYKYDALDRLTDAFNDALKGSYYLYDTTYDKNGNITGLLRNGRSSDDSNTATGSIDWLQYTYGPGNKLVSVTDANTGSFGEEGFKDGNKTGNDYAYDLNGNLLMDLNKGIQANGISYNHLNLPTEVKFDSNDSKKITYFYDAIGTKLMKEVEENGVSKITEYAGNFNYENNALRFFGHAEGYVAPKNPTNLGEGYDYIYQYKDHLGNIRLSYKNKGSGSMLDLEIQEENNYYPFGLKHKGYNNVVNGIDHKFEYNGTEFEGALGFDIMEMDVRQYDPAIARFTSIDPVVHHSQSTYTAFDNNPVFWSDPSGADSGTDGFAGFGRWDTIYENITTGETVEVEDDIEKTILVNDSDFQKAQFFANEINANPNENGLVSFGVSKDIAQGYSDFYDSVNSYDGFSLSNLYDYAFVKPELTLSNPDPVGASGGLELIGGPAGQLTKNGGRYLANLLGKTITIQKHHIIPVAVYRKYKSALAPFMKLGGGYNLKKLPTPFHGYHPQYNEYVGKLINQLGPKGNINASNLRSLQGQLNKELNKAYGSGMKLNDYFRFLNSKL